MKKVAVTALNEVLVKNDELILQLGTDAEPIALSLTPDVARDVAHIIADALRSRKDGKIPSEGEILVHADLTPARKEEVIGALGLEEKFVFQAASNGSSKVTFRLSADSALKWAKDTLRLIEERRGRRHH